MQLELKQKQFEEKQEFLSKYLKNKDVIFTEEEVGPKLRSINRLKSGSKLQFNNYVETVKIMQEVCQNKQNPRIPKDIFTKALPDLTLKRDEILTSDFKNSQDFITFIDHGWEQDWESDYISYKSRFEHFLKNERKIEKKYFIHNHIEISAIAKCEEKYQLDDEVYKKIDKSILVAVSKLFRYNGNFITLGERAFLERLIKKDVEFLMDKKIKLSMGNKFCPGPIKLKDNEITIYGKFIWLLKFGEYNNFLLNNLYQERDIFNNFAETYLSKN